MFVKYEINAPRAQQQQIWKSKYGKIKVLHFDPIPSPRGVLCQWSVSNP